MTWTDEDQSRWTELEKLMQRAADARDPSGALRSAVDGLFDADSETGEYDMTAAVRETISKVAKLLGATTEQILAARYPEPK